MDMEFHVENGHEAKQQESAETHNPPELLRNAAVAGGDQIAAMLDKRIQTRERLGLDHFLAFELGLKVHDLVE